MKPEGLPPGLEKCITGSNPEPAEPIPRSPMLFF